MKKKIKKSFAIILAALMAVMFIPEMAFAGITDADNQNVVVSASYKGEKCAVDGKTIKLIVPKNTTKTFDASNLSLTYDGAAVAPNVEWESGSDSINPGESAGGVVSYKLSAGGKVNTSYYTFAVVEYEAPSVSGEINKRVTSGETLYFGKSEFTSHYKQNDGDELAYVTIDANMGTSRYGTFYVGGIEYYLSDSIPVSDLGDVTFVSGDEGEPEYHVNYYEKNNDDSVGYINLNIEISGTSIGNVYSETVSQGKSIYLPISEINSKFKTISGSYSNFSTISFTSLPVSSEGKIYYNNSAVGTDVEYSYSDACNGLKFTAGSSFSGYAYAGFSVKDSAGASYSGAIVINVKKGSTSALDSIAATTYDNESVTFSASKFNSAMKAATGNNLNYVKFSLPASSKGVLYYEYTSSSKYDSKVSEGTKYYRTGSGNKLIDDVTFVPKSGYTGKVTIEYTGVDTEGESLSGEIIITVKEGSGTGSLKDISYESKQSKAVHFDTDDFTGVLKKVSDYNLNYVKFTLPDTTYGTLYYDYTDSTGKYDSKVTSSTCYYRTGSSKKLIEDVAFVPSGIYTGTITIKYTAYDSNGDSYSGNIKVTVKSDTISAVNATVANGSVLYMPATNMNSAFKSASGYNIDYVQFSLPSSTYGLLYYGYNTATSGGTLVKSTDKYYISGSNLLSNVAFVPNNSYTGTFDLNYTAYASTGAGCSGIIRITVTAGATPVQPTVTTGDSKYFKDVTKAAGYSWVSEKVDYLYEKGVVKGTATTSAGTTYSPAAKITRGDFVLMLYRAFGLSGTVTDNFSDVKKNSYYYEAIGVAKSLGIATGFNNKFNPDSNLSRQDAMVLIYRAIKITGKKTLAETSDVSRFTDKDKIESYASTAVGTLVNAGIINGYENGTFVPKGPITRAEMAVVLYNTGVI